MKNILLTTVIASAFMLNSAQAFNINQISGWGKKKIKPLAYQVETSGSNLRGYSWCDPAMKVFVFYGASSKGGNFSTSSVKCTPQK